MCYKEYKKKFKKKKKKPKSSIAKVKKKCLYVFYKKKINFKLNY